ncbi:MAG: hypothetical protein IT385_05270 [Deltaproteobacteria bacterium]|nr:hypothetical protein [Deltaproteobacteria bacterium]
MNIRRPLQLIPCLVALALAACGDDGAKNTDTTQTTDASQVTDTATSETTTDTVETDTGDTTAPTETETSAGDTIVDTDASTPPCVPAEETFEEPRILDCNNLLTQVLYWEDYSATACPPYYTHGDDRYASLEAIQAALGCDACEYRASIGVDFIGCVSGFRTGYEVYNPTTGEGCLEAVYGTPKGLLRNLCQWEEKACYAECDEDCQEGVVGAVDQAQLSGATGTSFSQSGNPVGQSFVVGKAGILTGIEVRLTRCTATSAATLTLRDAEGNEIAWAEITNEAIPEGCNTTQSDLVEGTRGPGYFAIETQCIPVAVGDALSFSVAPVPCLEEPCAEYVGLGEDNRDPYALGTFTYPALEQTLDEVDLAFKVYVQ